MAIFNLMEDAATAEISRSQIWQWIRNSSTLDSGEQATRALVARILAEELERLGDPEGYAPATALFSEVALAEEYVEFLTMPAYQRFP